MAIAAQPFGASFLDSGRTRSTVRRMAEAEDRSADEARLAQRAAQGDGDAFATLYTRYEKRAYNLCLRILGSEDDAADATQEAFVRVLRRLPKLEGRELAFGSYLFTSARHACYDLIERRKRAEPSDEITEGAVPVAGASVVAGSASTPATRTTIPSATSCSRRARTRFATRTPRSRSASARCSCCASSRTSPTTRSRSSWR
jgi:RNA polymerase sigma factor (sigma-70 family)